MSVLLIAVLWLSKTGAYRSNVTYNVMYVHILSILQKHVMLCIAFFTEHISSPCTAIGQMCMCVSVSVCGCLDSNFRAKRFLI